MAKSKQPPKAAASRTRHTTPIPHATISHSTTAHSTRQWTFMNKSKTDPTWGGGCELRLPDVNAPLSVNQQQLASEQHEFALWLWAY